MKQPRSWSKMIAQTFFVLSIISALLFLWINNIAEPVAFGSTEEYGIGVLLGILVYFSAYIPLLFAVLFFIISLISFVLYRKRSRTDV